METGRYRRRTLKKTYELPNGTISVLFPKFISELFAVSLDLKTDSVKEIISNLQGMCLAEGLKPEYGKWTNEDRNRESRDMLARDKELRVSGAKERKEAEKKKLGADFPERVKMTRNRLGDF